jgi:hypothetical protein
MDLSEVVLSLLREIRDDQRELLAIVKARREDELLHRPAFEKARQAWAESQARYQCSVERAARIRPYALAFLVLVASALLIMQFGRMFLGWGTDRAPNAARTVSLIEPPPSRPWEQAAGRDGRPW